MKNFNIDDEQSFLPKMIPIKKQKNKFADDDFDVNKGRKKIKAFKKIVKLSKLNGDEDGNNYY